MNNPYLIAGVIVGVAIIGFIFAGRKSEAPVALEKEVAQQAVGSFKDGMYQLDPVSSSISWQGEFASGVKKETGTVKLSSGSFNVVDGTIALGEFTIDLNTIESSPFIERLVNHLKSPDFFNVAEYPTATFTLKTIAPSSPQGGEEGRYVIGGDLTVKDITKPISFMADLKSEGDMILGKASFAINRAEWEIKYNSASFFSDLGDKVIRDAVTIGLDLKAQKVIE